MIDIKLEVEVNDGDRWVVAPTAGCLIAAERHFGKPAAELFASPSIESLAWLAWEQRRRDGSTVPTFDRFVEILVDIQTDVDADPLPGTP